MPPSLTSKERPTVAISIEIQGTTWRAVILAAFDVLRLLVSGHGQTGAVGSMPLSSYRLDVIRDETGGAGMLPPQSGFEG